MIANRKALIQFTDRGLYCPKAKVYIDPWKSVDKALVTHGHADHARRGSKHYLCSTQAAPVIKYRLGEINVQTIDFNEKLQINGVNFSFHPAGHIPGSAQIKVEYKGESWVISGDYKTENDGLSEPFEAVKCNHFITECTFGLPIYRWEKQNIVFSQINQWWNQCKENKQQAVIAAYSLGKAQRIISGLDPNIGYIYSHYVIEDTNKILRSQNYQFNNTQLFTSIDQLKSNQGSILIVPPSALNSKVLGSIKNKSVAYTSGWMRLRGAKRRQNLDRGFVISDHADWNGLINTIKATEAEKVFVTHGYTDTFSKYLQEVGYDAKIVATEYTGEQIDSEQKNVSE